MKEFIINNNDAGQRLDRFVAKTAPMLPSSLLQKYIRIKRIKVGGKSAKRDYKLAVDDTVQMYINDEFFEKLTDDNAYLKIGDPVLDVIYEDENILLINKPAGILCHSDSSYDHGSILARVQAYLHKSGQWKPREENSFAPALCNRIDRNTSGIVIAAKNAEALRIINEKLKQNEIERYYLAVVIGTPKPEASRLEGYIFKDAVKNRVYVTKHREPGSKTAIMEYVTLESKDNLSLLECKLITGRTHQIRAQLADIGFPILGDDKYGSKRQNKQHGENRQVLCSYKITFNFTTNSGLLEYLNGQTFKLSGLKENTFFA